MEAVWGRIEVVGKCSVDEGCGLRAIPVGQRGRGDGRRHREPPVSEPCAGPTLAPRSPLCTAMTGRWCCVKLLSRGEESWGDGLLKGDLSISVFFTVGEMPAGTGGGVTARAPPKCQALGCWARLGGTLGRACGCMRGTTAPGGVWVGVHRHVGVHHWVCTGICVHVRAHTCAGGCACAPAPVCTRVQCASGVCACTHVHTCVSACVWLCAQLCMGVHACAHRSACVCRRAHMCFSMSVRASVCTVVHACAGVCLDVHTDLHVYELMCAYAWVRISTMPCIRECARVHVCSCMCISIARAPVCTIVRTSVHLCAQSNACVCVGLGSPSPRCPWAWGHPRTP